MNIINFIFRIKEKTRKFFEIKEESEISEKKDNFQFYIENFNPDHFNNLNDKLNNKGFKMTTAPQSASFFEYLYDSNTSDKKYIIKKAIQNNFPQYELGTNTAILKTKYNFYARDYPQVTSNGEIIMNEEDLETEISENQRAIGEKEIHYNEDKTIRHTAQKFKTEDLNFAKLSTNYGFFNIFGEAHANKLLPILKDSKIKFLVASEKDEARFVNYSIISKNKETPIFYLSANKSDLTSRKWALGIKEIENISLEDKLILEEDFEKDLLKKYYNQLSDEVVKIWKNNKNKIAKKETEDGKKRHAYIEDMKKVEKYVKEKNYEDLLFDEEKEPEKSNLENSIIQEPEKEEIKEEPLSPKQEFFEELVLTERE